MGGWAIYAIVLIIVAVAVFLFARGAAPGKASDAQVIEQLAKGGSNLTPPHNIEYRFYFPSRELAEWVTTTVRADGFQVSVEEVAQGNQYILRTARAIVPLDLREQDASGAITGGGSISARMPLQIFAY